MPGTGLVWTPARWATVLSGRLLTVTEALIYSGFPERQHLIAHTRSRRPARSGETSLRDNIHHHQRQPGAWHLFPACYS